MSGVYKTFPPLVGQLRLPASSRRGALAGMALYSACRSPARLMQRVAWTAVRLFGPGVLPGRARAWAPLAAGVAEELHERWRDELGEFDAVAGYQRAQPWRAGCALLLLRGGKPIAFLKVSSAPGCKLPDEERALRALARYGPRAFTTPEPLASGTAAGMRYLAVAALPPRLHSPPSGPPLSEIAAELQEALADLPRPAEAAAHWRPMHGDLTPWNLRQMGRRLFLLDWEEAGWGPPHADVVLYAATMAVIGGPRSRRASAFGATEPGALEAIRFWLRRCEGWRGTSRDDRMATIARGALLSMAAAAAPASDAPRAGWNLGT